MRCVSASKSTVTAGVPNKVNGERAGAPNFILMFLLHTKKDSVHWDSGLDDFVCVDV